jgi:hypothetical protein
LFFWKIEKKWQGWKEVVWCCWEELDIAVTGTWGHCLVQADPPRLGWAVHYLHVCETCVTFWDIHSQAPLRWRCSKRATTTRNPNLGLKKCAQNMIFWFIHGKKGASLTHKRRKKSERLKAGKADSYIQKIT